MNANPQPNPAPAWTPGPWKIDENTELPLAVIKDAEDGMGICELGEYTPLNIANARLIAAAPEMAEALADAQQALAHAIHVLGHNAPASTSISMKYAEDRARAILARLHGEGGGV